MKAALLALFTVFSISAYANVEQPKRIFQCETNSDPDSLSVDVISAFGKTYAALSEQSCDGDCFAEDLVELKRLDSGNDAMITYVEVAGARASYLGMKIQKPSRKTRGLVLNIPFTGGSSTVKGTSSPLGNTFGALELECKASVPARR